MKMNILILENLNHSIYNGEYYILMVNDKNAKYIANLVPCILINHKFRTQEGMLYP